MLWGNLYYVYMARKIAAREKRGDVCAMPYGICTPGAFAFIYVIVTPTYYTCLSSHDKPYCQELAWYVALASNFFTGLVLLLLCIFGEFIRKNTPSVALLTSISGIGFAILALNEYLPIAEVPIVSFIPFTIVMLGYFAGGLYQTQTISDHRCIFCSNIWPLSRCSRCISNRYSTRLGYIFERRFSRS